MCCVCAIKDVTHLVLHINKSYLIFSNDKGAETCYEKNLALTCKIRLLSVLIWLSFKETYLYLERDFSGVGVILPVKHDDHTIGRAT